MRICVLTTGHTAFDDRIFYKEILSLRKKHDDIYIVAPYEKRQDEKSGVKIIGVNKASSLIGRYKLVDEVIKKAAEIKADIYHFHDLEIVLKVMKLKKLVPGCKIIYDVHEYYPEMITMSKKIPGILKPLGAFYVNSKEMSVAKKLDYIITTDDYNKERFSKVNSNVDVIYNFSEFEAKEDDKTKKEYDVIYQGGISIERGALNLVKAINIAKKKQQDIKMVFVGTFDDEGTKNTIFKYIEDNNLSDNIKYIGRVPHQEVENYIRKSKMGVVAFLPYPRYAKNIPIKQFEYMSCGVPVIGGYLPSVKRFVTAYNSGIIVDPTDPKDIANAILKLLDDPELCLKLGRNGIKAVKESYNWGNMENKLFSIYDKLN